MGEADDLAILNDELRKQGKTGSGPWLALESNPDVFTDFSHKIGLARGWRFCDVLGLDPELLQLVPQPVLGAVLLFPCSERIYAARKQQDAALRSGGSFLGASASKESDLFFLKQVVGFGNACGTVACLHAVSNFRTWVSLCDGALETFVQHQMAASPEQRGEALLKDPELRASSESAASSHAAQTQCPDRHGPPLDHHFAAFTRSRQNRLIELDGTKRGPVDHGPSSATSFLSDVAAVVKRSFMDADPDAVDFALLALCRESDEG
ncbi:unnamed protein product [Effrenium voratum]|nr:unnamed protein product [Effrenium voratum]